MTGLKQFFCVVNITALAVAFSGLAAQAQLPSATPDRNTPDGTINTLPPSAPVDLNPNQIDDLNPNSDRIIGDDSLSPDDDDNMINNDLNNDNQPNNSTNNLNPNADGTGDLAPENAPLETLPSPSGSGTTLQDPLEQ